METDIYARNRRIWHNTKEKMNDYKFEKARKINLKPEELIVDTDTNVKYFNHDMFSVIFTSYDAGLRPLVVMVSNNFPIDSEFNLENYEYDLYRISNLYLTGIENLYPLALDEAIYVPCITVFKNPEGELLKDAFEISVLFVNCLKRPETHTIDGKIIYRNEEDKEKTQKTIKAIFSLAVNYNYDGIIIDIFGRQCDHPLHSIVNIFKTEIPRSNLRYVFFYTKRADFEKDDSGYQFLDLMTSVC